MDLLYIWYDNRYWSKLLFGTTPTPAYDLKVKDMDLNIYVKSFALKFLRSLNFYILVWIYFLFGMIIDIDPKFY